MTTNNYHRVCFNRLPQRPEETAETHVQSDPRVKESGSGNVAFETEQTYFARNFILRKHSIRNYAHYFWGAIPICGNITFKTTDTICGERFSLRK